MKKKKYLTITILSLLAFWLYWTNSNITTTNIQIERAEIPTAFDGFKIAHVSDLHNHQWKDKLINKIKASNPNIIEITGDLVDSSKTDIDIAIDFIERAKKIAPVYYVTGNHEAWLDDYSALEQRLEKTNIHMMDNKVEFIEMDGSKIQIVGVEDPDFQSQNGQSYIQEELIKEKIDENINRDYYNIVLSHRPEVFAAYTRAKANLILSGHAHGGQFRIPFLNKGLVAPNQGFFPKYSEGLYSKDSSDMIVSRGLGNSIIPIRVNNTFELVIVELKTK